MVDSITGYLAPPTDEEEMRALAERLRGRSLGGQMLSLSGDPVLRGAGETGVARADMEAKQAGVLKRALEEREQRTAENQLNRDAQLAQMQEQQRLIGLREIAGDERGAEQRMAEIAQAQINADLNRPYETYLLPDGTEIMGRLQEGNLVDEDNFPLPEGTTIAPPKSSYGRRPTGTERKAYTSNVSLAKEIESIEGLVDALSDTAVEQLNNTTGDVALDYARKAGPDSAVDLAARNMMYTDPQANATMERFARLESEVLKLISGKQITGIEADKTNKWSPNYPGLKLNERIRRANALKSRLESDMGSFEKYYPDWSLRNFGGDPQGDSQTGSGIPISDEWTEEKEARWQELNERNRMR